MVSYEDEMLYRTDATGLATAPPRVVDCHSLLHLRAPKAVRACDAADVCDELVILSRPTLHVAAVAYGVSLWTVARARRLLPQERDQVRKGKRPIVPPRTPVPFPVMPPTAADVRARLLNLVDEIGGVDATLDLLATVGEQLAA
jgi:hypothetical protein